MSASTLFWTGGANNGTFSDANNWNTARDGSGSALAPGAGGAGDTLYIENTSQAINGADTGISIAAMYITFGGSVGTAGTPLRFQCTGTLTIRSSVGTHYIGATSATAIVTTNIQKTGTGKVYLSGPGTYTAIYAGASCRVDVSSNAAVTTIKSAAQELDVAANATDLTTLEIAAGNANVYRPAVTANISGTLYTKGTDALITTSNVWKGGKLFCWSAAADGTSAAITTSNVKEGGYATSKGSPFRPVITNRESYGGGSNFADSTNAVFTNAAIDIGEGIPSVI